MSSRKNGFCQRLLNALTTVNVTFSYTVNDTKVKRRNQTGMKLNLGFSCGSWPAVTAVLTVPPNPIKHAQRAVASLLLSLPLFLLFSFFFFLQKGAIDIRCKIHGVGAEERNGRGVGCLEPSVNSWEVWFHRLAPPCQGPDWAGQEAQERPGLLKDTNRWEAALEGGAPGGIEKADLQGLLWAQSTGQIRRRMVDRRIAEAKRGDG